MMVFLTPSNAKEAVRIAMRAKRLAHGLTQEGLAKRSGVALATLRKFEQKGDLSLQSFLDILMVLGGMEAFVGALEQREEAFKSIEDVLKERPKNPRKRGWRT